MIYALIFGIVILLTIFASNLLERKAILAPVLSRKILHLVAIGLSAVSVFYIDNSLLLPISVLCLPLLVFLVYKGFFRDPQTGRKSWGIVYFNAVFVALLYLFSNAEGLIYYPLMTLALSDGLAAVVGVSTQKPKERQAKTLKGSLAFFVATISVFTISPLIWSDLPNLPFEITLVLSFLLTIVEFITKNSLDNISVPMAVVYWLLVDHLDTAWVGPIFLGVLLGGWVVYKLNWLNLEGSMLSVILGVVFLTSPFPESIVPAIVFFSSGSLLSKLPAKNSSGGPRNAMQVFCNGGPGLFAICLHFITGHSAWLLASIVSFAVALSDTTSSELGIRYGKKTFDIMGMRKLLKGASGAVSILGLVVGLIAPFILATITSFFIDLNINQICAIALLGFSGNIMDSLFGSIVQTKYYDAKSNSWLDERSLPGSKTEGIKGFDNNLTNLISISLVTILSYFIFHSDLQLF